MKGRVSSEVSLYKGKRNVDLLTAPSFGVGLFTAVSFCGLLTGGLEAVGLGFGGEAEWILLLVRRVIKGKERREKTIKSNKMQGNFKPVGDGWTEMGGKYHTL